MSIFLKMQQLSKQVGAIRGEQAREAGILSKPQNEHCATVRCAFVDYVDHMARSGEISEALAGRATL